MGRAGNRIFGDASTGSEEAGDEIVGFPRIGQRGDDRAAHRQLAQNGVVRGEGPQFLLAGYFDQVVVLVLADPARLIDAGCSTTRPKI